MSNPQPLGHRPIPSKLVQVELEVTLEGLTLGALAWVPRYPRPYVGMPRQIADRWWWVARIPDQAKRGTLSPVKVTTIEDEGPSAEEQARLKLLYSARARKSWATRRRAAAG